MSTVIDLSQAYYEGMPHATTIPAPSFRPVRTMEEHGLRCLELRMPIHLGTHLDAPSHFIADGATIDQVPPSTLIGPAVCVSVDKPADQPIEIADLEAADARPGDALLIRTGWDELFTDPGYLHHPYLSVPAAEWIVRRGFRLVGVDTVTPELPGDLRPTGYPCPVHTTLLGAGVLILENLVLREVTNTRFTLVVGALKIVGGDGSPARVLALPV
ncbi:cyclase family protein [Pseudonocardia acaciae]|uniref:cyclase family protein n=1 Tax=Pseudonocardia acaciae TaxID=551276 RepID=UPI0006886EDB|nr:cyclase family protein [Pseudonocardia acaciae]